MIVSSDLLPNEAVREILMLLYLGNIFQCFKNLKKEKKGEVQHRRENITSFFQHSARGSGNPDALWIKIHYFVIMVHLHITLWKILDRGKLIPIQINPISELNRAENSVQIVKSDRAGLN